MSIADNAENAHQLGLNRRRVILISLMILVLVIVLRESGVVDLSLYRSTSNAMYSESFNRGIPGSDSRYTKLVELVVVHDGETVYRNSINLGTVPEGKSEAEGITVPMRGELEITQTGGNAFIPLRKTLEFEYSCTLTDDAPVEGYDVSIEMSGNVAMKIEGLCSRTKALKLAQDEVYSQMAGILDKKQISDFDLP